MNDTTFTDEEQIMIDFAESSDPWEHIELYEDEATITVEDKELVLEVDDVDMPMPTEKERMEVADKTGTNQERIDTIELYNRKTPTVDEPIEQGGIARVPSIGFNPLNAEVTIETGCYVELMEIGTDWFEVRVMAKDGNDYEIGYGYYED